MSTRQHKLLNKFAVHHKHVLPLRPVASGQLVSVVGLTLEATGCRAPVGSLCSIETMVGELVAEVVGFDDKLLYLMPIEELRGVFPGARVKPLGEQSGFNVGLSLLGRVLDGSGVPLDGLGLLYTDQHASLHGPYFHPLSLLWVY